MRAIRGSLANDGERSRGVIDSVRRDDRISVKCIVYKATQVALPTPALSLMKTC